MVCHRHAETPARWHPRTHLPCSAAAAGEIATFPALGDQLLRRELRLQKRYEQRVRKGFAQLQRHAATAVDVVRQKSSAAGGTVRKLVMPALLRYRLRNRPPSLGHRR